MNEQDQERRLEREAQACLGTLCHPRLGPGDYATVRVEVGYGYDGDEWGHAGHFIVRVPSLEPTGDPDLDMLQHPATLAEDVAGDKLACWVAKGHADWTEIYDVRAA